jgi:hypothetical protein
MLGRLIYGTHKQLKMTAQRIGANTVGTLFTGLIAKDPQLTLANNIHRKTPTLSATLLGQ